MEGVVVGVCDGGGLMRDLGGTRGPAKKLHPALSTWHTWTVNSHTFSVAGLVRCTLTFKRRVTQGSVLPGRGGVIVREGVTIEELRADFLTGRV